MQVLRKKHEQRAAKSTAVDKGPARSTVIFTEITFILLITLAAAVLRFYKLGEWSWWVDEIFTLRDSLDPREHYHHWTYPLSYIMIGTLLKSTGITEWYARVIPAIFGIISVPVLYLLTRKSFGRTAALIAIIFLAFSPWHIYWSQMARFYTMTMFFTAMSVFVFWRALETDSRWKMAAASGLMILGILSHYSAFFILAALGFYTLVQLVLKRWERPPGFNFKTLACFYGIFIISFVVMLERVVALLTPYMPGGKATTGSDWGNPIKGIAYSIFSCGYRVGFGLALFALVTALVLIRRRNPAGVFLASLAVIPIAMLSLAGSFSMGENRYALVTLPAFLILAGLGIKMIADDVKKQSGPVYLAFAAGALILMPMLQHNIFYFTSTYNGERWNYRAACNYVMERAGPRDVVMTPMTFPVWMYVKEKGLTIDKLRIEQAERYRASGRRCWIISEDSTRTKSAGTSAAKWLAEKTDLLASFPAASPAADYGVSVYLLEPLKK